MALICFLNSKSDDFKNDLKEKITNFMPSIFSLSENNVNQIFYEFYSILTSTINIDDSLKKLSKKQTCLKNKPWISKGLLFSIKRKRKSFLKHITFWG